MVMNTQPDQYVLGKGRFYFAPRLADGSLDAYRFIGNVPTYTLTPSSTTLDHVSSTGGLNVKDRSIIISSDLAIGFTTDSMSLENKALWMGGTVDLVTTTSATAQTLNIAAPKKGYIYLFGVSPSVPTGLKDITVTSVMQGGTALVAGVDYIVNGRTGQLSFPTAGAAIEGTPVTVTYSVAASSKSQVNNRNKVITGAVRFLSDNPDTGIGKVDEEHFLPFVRLAAAGDWGLISDTWQSFQFTGEVLQNYDAVGNVIPRHTVTPLTIPTV